MITSFNRLHIAENLEAQDSGQFSCCFSSLLVQHVKYRKLGWALRRERNRPPSQKNIWWFTSVRHSLHREDTLLQVFINFSKDFKFSFRRVRHDYFASDRGHFRIQNQSTSQKIGKRCFWGTGKYERLAKQVTLLRPLVLSFKFKCPLPQTVDFQDNGTAET